MVYSPADALVLPRDAPPAIKEILSAAEIERILAAADLSDPLGLRDRAMMELFYSTGMRRREMRDLELSDIDFERETVKIKGKNRKIRLVPLGKRAGRWLRLYLNSARPNLVETDKEQALFVNRLGTKMGLDHIGARVRNYFKNVGVDKTGACHLFRHSMATLMLKAGADIRSVQEILGHSSLTVTQLYTHLNIEHLIEVHRRTHPAGRPENKSLKRQNEKRDERQAG